VRAIMSELFEARTDSTKRPTEMQALPIYRQNAHTRVREIAINRFMGPASMAATSQLLTSDRCSSSLFTDKRKRLGKLHAVSFIAGSGHRALVTASERKEPPSTKLGGPGLRMQRPKSEFLPVSSG
jgi:hypothetical protein